MNISNHALKSTSEKFSGFSVLSEKNVNVAYGDFFCMLQYIFEKFCSVKTRENTNPAQ